jgi:hypothetical protein
VALGSLPLDATTFSLTALALPSRGIPQSLSGQTRYSGQYTALISSLLAIIANNF